MKAAEALAACMERAGVKRVYGVVGTSVVSLINALYQFRERIRYISCRHEQVCASMADTEGRLTGRPGIAVSHSGPGTLNTAISLAIAWKDSSPMIAVSGAVARKLRGLGGFLEVEHGDVFRPICKAVYRVEEAGTITELFAAAWRQALSPPRGPVLLEIPEDIWLEDISPDLGKLDLEAESPPPIHEGEVRKALKELGKSERPVILSGGGVVQSNASPDLVKLVEALGVPVVTTGNGRGSIPEDHPLCYGRAGFAGGNPVADHTLSRADLIMIIGATLSETTTYAQTWEVPGKLVIVNADRDALERERRPQAVLKIHGDALEFIRAARNLLLGMGLSNALQARMTGWKQELEEKRAQWRDMLDSSASPDRDPVSAGFVMKTLRGMLPRNAIITTGQGVHLVYANDYLSCYEPGTFLSSNNFGAMGFGFPSALAAKLLYPERQVFAILGDGDFMMTLQDMETMVREKIGVKIIVINDNSYRVLWLTQQMVLGGASYGTEHGNPDMMALSNSFGIQGFRIRSAPDVGRVLGESLSTDAPALIEILIDKQDMAPTNMEAVIKMRGLGPQ